MEKNIRGVSPASAMMLLAAGGDTRAQYELIIRDCLDMNLTNALPLPGYLRSEVVINNGDNALQFSLRADETNNGEPVFPSEERLSTNDAFYVTGVAVMFQKYSAVPATRLQTSPVQGPLPNTGVAFDAATTVPSLRMAYNSGKLSLSQNDRIFLRRLDLWRMQYVDTAQQGIAAGYVANAAALDQGFTPTDAPMIRLNGQSQIDAVINFGTGFTAPAAGPDCVAILYLKGFRVQNAGVARSSR